MLWHYLVVVGLSALPIIEVRGAIPVGLAFGIPLWLCFIMALIGSTLPSPFIILLFRKILHWLEKSRFKIFQRYGEWMRRKIEKKSTNLQNTEKQKVGFRGYSLLALFIISAIPFPGFGVWSASAVAGFLDMRVKPALAVIFAGNIIASLCILFIFHIFI